MTYTESTLRLQVLGQTMGRPHGGQRVVVNAGTLERYRQEQGKQKHEPLWLEVEVKRGSRVEVVNVEVVA